MIVWYWDDVLEDYTPGMAVAIGDTYDDAIEALAQRHYSEQSPRAAFHFPIEECREWARKNFLLADAECVVVLPGSPWGTYCYGG